MRRLRVETTIHEPRLQVWAHLADLPGIAAWNPGVRAASWTTAVHDGVGAGRRCETPVGGLDEVVGVWEKPDRLVMQVTGDGPIALLFDRGVADFRLTGSPAGPTTVSLDYELHARRGGLGEAVVARQLRVGLQDLLDGLRTHVETRATA